MLRGPRALRVLALAVAGLLMLLRLLDPEPVQQLRYRYFDVLQQVWPRPSEPEPPLVMIDIDEASLQQIGQWPWPRTLLAELVQQCAAAGALAVGMDLLFAEPDRMSPRALARSMRQWPETVRASLQELPDHDQILAASLSAIPVVLGMAGQPHASAQPNGSRPIHSMLGGDPLSRVMHFPGVLGSLPELSSAAAAVGWVSLAPDFDGVVRQVPLLAAVGGQVYPALSIELLRLALGGDGWITLMSAAGLEQMVTQTSQGDLPIPIDAKGFFWVYYTRPGAAARTLSAHRVLAGQAADALRGRLVLVGSSATGFNDAHATPVAHRLPGLEIHANILGAILNDQLLIRPSWSLGVELAWLLTLILILLPGARWLGPVGLSVLVLSLLTLTLGISIAIFTVYRWLLDASFSWLWLLMLGIWLGTANAWQSFRDRRQIREAFQHYLAPELVTRLAQSPEPPRLGGECRSLSLMFCDIRGFTTLSEGLHPEHLGRLMNQYLSAMSAVVLQQGGTIDKYIGDCIMAFWNAPLDDPDHARHACLAALAMRAELSLINRHLQEQGLLGAEQALRIGIGIHTSEVFVGNFGSKQRFDYTALGDGVNVAARLESQCKTLRRDILVTRAVRDLVPDCAMEPLGFIQVRGKLESLEVFAL